TSPAFSPSRTWTYLDVETPSLTARREGGPSAETTRTYGPRSSERTASTGRATTFSRLPQSTEHRAIMPGRKRGSAWSTATLTGKVRDSFFSEAPTEPIDLSAPVS